MQQLHWARLLAKMGFSRVVIFLAACALGNGLAVPTAPVKETYGARPAQAPPAAIPQVKPAPSQRTHGEPVGAPAVAPTPQRYGGGRPAFSAASPSVVTITVTVFGPVAIETVTNTVIATQMINAVTTKDIRLSEYTTIPYDALATSTSRVFSPRQPETTTSFVTATNGAAGGVLTSTDYETKRKTVTVTSTSFDTITRTSISTCTIEHFSTAIDIEIVANYMTTTISETSTLTTVGVKRVTTTLVVPDQYY